MNILEEMFAKLNEVNTSDFINEIINTEQVNEDVINLNKKQLYDSGVNSEGEVLGYYAESTKIKKRKKGLPDDFYTLFDEGDFYKSFNLFGKEKSLVFDADGLKNDGTNLFEKYGINIMGLTEENKIKLIEKLLPLIQDKFLNEVL